MFTEMPFKWMADGLEYWIDTMQRSVLFMDVVRQRGNTYMAHLQDGQPPVLVFNYEPVLDGRTFDRPVNYTLVRILNRRDEEGPDRRREETLAGPARERRTTPVDRRHKVSFPEEAPAAVSRPIIIFDPRAGHGPGIGGSKQDSQIGMALDAGHPVYFLVFSMMPVGGQTLADVRNAQIRFVEAVRERHPDAPAPAIIGNCQGGWAAALVGAERPDLVGPMVFNGSPLSYWAGVEGINPLRYMGGLLGGAWIASLCADLGNGIFDGAHIVANFENLNPANTYWTKQYHLFAHVDTEVDRYLQFERWWGGFFQLTGAEIHQIVDGLFIGNRLERGEFQLEKKRLVDLTNNTNPVVLFASFGDNITPPQQAFNWIIKAYGDVEAIKRRGQVIVFITHPGIGHLGIFVSAKIARREHKTIIASFDMLYHLEPGLYEMRVLKDPDRPGEYIAEYVAKDMNDILAFDDALNDEATFLSVRQFSELLDGFYRYFVSPWIRMATTPLGAETLRQLHPLRTSRYMLSDLNPWMHLFKLAADQIREGDVRQPAAADNRLRQWETVFSNELIDSLNQFRDARDKFGELMFKAIYDNPLARLLAEYRGPSDGEAVRAAA